MSTTEEVLRQSIARINSGVLRNEAQVVKSVIEPVLKSLDWDDSDPAQYYPEFPVAYSGGGHGEVDCALLGRSGHPLVFVEAKRIGNLNDDGVVQVFRYAANQGIPFLVLTDGDVWEFYLSMAEGTPPERKFYRVELRREDKITENAQFFEKFLHKNQIVNNISETRNAAEDLRNTGLRQRISSEAIPVVWRRLLETPDEALCSLIADEVERECGTQPDLDDVETFLSEVLNGLSTNIATTDTGAAQQTTQASAPTPRPPARRNAKIIGFVLDGQSVEVGVGNRTLAALLKVFNERDGTFMERFAGKTTGRTRRLVARNRNDLYDEVHLRDYSLDLENGWWLGTNIGSGPIRKHITTACDIMGIQFGSQCRLIER